MRVTSLLFALAALVVAVSAGTRPSNATDLGTGCGVSCKLGIGSWRRNPRWRRSPSP